jgi:hypothetical protein
LPIAGEIGEIAVDSAVLRGFAVPPAAVASVDAKSEPELTIGTQGDSDTRARPMRSAGQWRAVHDGHGGFKRNRARVGGGGYYLAPMSLFQVSQIVAKPAESIETAGQACNCKSRRRWKPGAQRRPYRDQQVQGNRRRSKVHFRPPPFRARHNERLLNVAEL